MLYPIQNEIRNRLDISGIWDFQIDPDETGEKNSWPTALPAPRPMAVPGSWNEQVADLFNYFGAGWYLQRIYVPAGWQGQRIFLRVGSANYFGTVFVNGVMVGFHEGGHLPFAFDITDLIQWRAENTIAIRVENHLKPTRVPSANMSDPNDAASIAKGYPSTTFDFFPFTGIHRPVVLYSVPEIHITDVTVVTEDAGDPARLRVTAWTNGGQDTGRLALTGDGKILEAPLTFTNGMAQATLEIPGARLWSDKDPYLYDLSIATITDRYTLKIGIRRVEVRGKQILLNGRPVQLNGFGRHEDFIASGKGLNLPLLVKDYDLMRWTGANSYRTSHYPYSEEEMQLADREGFLIIDETPAVSLKFDNPENMAERIRMCRQQIEELIARDKNHPAVVMWSVANEPAPPDGMARYTGEKVDLELEKASTKFLHAMIAHARKLDPTRPVTLVGMTSGLNEWMETCDVICINRYWSWYVLPGELERGAAMMDQELDGLWELFGKPIIVTEFGADTQPGLHGHPAVMWTEEYQAEFIRGYLEAGARKDFVAGMQVWNFADFAAVQSIMRVGGQNMKGVFTRTRQPKMAAHVLREFWTRPSPPQIVDAQRQSPEPVSDFQTANVPSDEILKLLDTLAARLDGKKPNLTTTLKFDFSAAGIYRLVIERGACRIEPGEGDAVATMQVELRDAQKLFTGKLDPIVAVMTGKIKTSGDARALLVLQDLR